MKKSLPPTKIILYPLFIIHFSLTLQQNNYNSISYEKNAFTTRPEPVCHNERNGTGAGTYGTEL